MWSSIQAVLGTVECLARRPSTYDRVLATRLNSLETHVTTDWDFFCSRPCQWNASPSSGSSISLWTVTCMVSPLWTLVIRSKRNSPSLPVRLDQRSGELTINQKHAPLNSVRRKLSALYSEVIFADNARSCQYWRNIYLIVNIQSIRCIYYLSEHNSKWEVECFNLLSVGHTWAQHNKLIYTSRDLPSIHLSVWENMDNLNYTHKGWYYWQF